MLSLIFVTLGNEHERWLDNLEREFAFKFPNISISRVTFEDAQYLYAIEHYPSILIVKDGVVFDTIIGKNTFQYIINRIGLNENNS